MKFNIPQVLENDSTILYSLKKDDFEALYEVASDPKIWEQHPNKDRWKKEVFRVFFDGGIQSNGAFKIMSKSNGEIIGSTRFYDYNEKENSILIGYTFYATKYWGKGINSAVKKLMLNYIFQYVDLVYFQIGVSNIRSQIAIGRLGAKKIGEQQVDYFGETPRMNYIFVLSKEEWYNKQRQLNS